MSLPALPVVLLVGVPVTLLVIGIFALADLRRFRKARYRRW